MASTKMAVYESMSKWTVGVYTVRIWRNENGWPAYDFYDTTDLRIKCSELNLGLQVVDGHKYEGQPTPKQIALAFLSCGRINAIEVLNFKGDGFVLYPEWP